MLWCLRQESAKTMRLLELLPVKPLNFWGSGSTQKKCLLAYCSRHQHGEFSGGFGDSYSGGLGDRSSMLASLAWVAVARAIKTLTR